MKLLTLTVAILLSTITAANKFEEIFKTPPHDARPRGYWVWPHGNFDYSAIRNELKGFKEKGLGGVDIFDLGITDNKDVIPAGPAFMSPEQIDGIAFVLEEAKKLDLKIGLIVSSSWNAGASWTQPEHAAMNLVAAMDTVQGPVKYDKTLPFPALPDSFTKSYGVFALHVPKNEKGMPRFYFDVATLVFPVTKAGILANPAQVKMMDAPDVAIELQEGRWIILRAVCTNFGQMLWAPSDNSNGLTIDHFSKEAVHDHFMEIINRLEKRCGPLGDTVLERLYLASYESNAGIIWTPTFAEDFYAMNGYRIEPYLPALFGVIIKDKLTTERFLYDYRKTVSDLFVKNLYRNARRICHKHGLKICSEAGGPGAPLHDVPTEDLLALGLLDIMRGEFWVDKRHRLKPDGFEELQIVKGIASAAHIYGHKIVEMEAFTSHDNWRQSPATLKPFADRAFCEGMNRVVYHTMSHNLPEAGLPGWSFGAGTHINTNLTWWDLSSAWHAYLTRCSALLQQGQFVAHACFYYGHEIPNFTQPKYIRPELGAGYDYDDINSEVLLTAEVENGRLRLPGGMSYPVLVLPEDKRMDLAVIKKIKELLLAGAVIIGSKPQRVYGLANFQEQELELNEIANELWGQKKPSNLDKKIGRGRLVIGKSTRQILENMGIGPDVGFLNAPSDTAMDFIHRRTARDDIYFIRNTTRNPIMAEVRFRVFNKQPELWDAVTGDIKKCGLYLQEKNGIRLPVHLDTRGSMFVLFREKTEGMHATGLKKDGRQLFPDRKNSLTEPFEVIQKKQRLIFQAAEPGTYEIVLSNGQQEQIHSNRPTEIAINGPWDVRFPYGWEAKTEQTFDKLISWTESDDAGIRAFSGTATYCKEFYITAYGEKNNQQVFLDLGSLYEIAQVYLNGHDVGISSFAPHRFDVTGILRSGANHLVVKVANTWLNRLIEDDKREEAERLTHTNLTRGPTGMTYWREAKPKASGLLGPVRLLVFQTSIIPLK
jgi:hypothetical protein